MIKQEGRRSKAVVADEILTLTKSSLLMHFRFLGPAFSAVKTEAQKRGHFHVTENVSVMHRIL